MSKVREKRSTSKSGFFLWNVKDNEAIWWFGPFFFYKFYNFKVFLAQKEKYQKILFWKSEKWKKEKSIWFNNLFFFKYHIYIILLVWILWFVSLFCRLQCVKPYFTTLVIFTFLIFVKMHFSKRQGVFNVSISQLNKTSH